MSKKHPFLTLSLATVFACVVGPAFAQSPDYASTITGSVDAAPAGSTVDYQVDVSNVGDADGLNEIILDIYLPSGVPCDVNAYLDGDADATAAFDALWNSVNYTENIFDPDDDESGVFFGVDANCENFLLQPQNLMLPAAEEGSWFFTVELPTPPLFEGNVHVSSATMDTDLNYGNGGCDDTLPCTDHPCLGPRISTIDPITATVELVNGPGGGIGATPEMGCGSLEGFTAGNIALIDRGKCAFDVKIANALFAGASGVLIADSDDFTDSTTEPDDVLNMACTNYCSESLITIPAAFISFANALLLHADIDAGNPITATIGQQDIGNGLKTEAYIWENPSDSQEDTNRDNNISSVTTTIGTPSAIFDDGFDSGDTTMWSYCTCWP